MSTKMSVQIQLGKSEAQFINYISKRVSQIKPPKLFTQAPKVKEVLFDYIHIPGSFLLRNSSRNEGALVVSVVHEDGSIKHFTINENDSQYFLQDKYFKTINDLVQNYAKEDVPNLENIANVRLLHPIITAYSTATPPLTDPFSESYPPSGRSPLNYSKSFPRSAMTNGPKGRYFSDSAYPIGESPPHSATIATTKGRAGGKSKSVKVGYLENSRRNEAETKPTWYRRGSMDEHQSNTRETVSKSNKYRRGSIDDRPPAPPPLPPEEPKYLESQSQTYIYSRAYDTDINRFQDLLEKLKFSDEHQKCDCGIYIKDSLFPGGWTIHRSTEETTKGMVFFINEEKTVSSWTLPQEVIQLLEPSHFQTLKSLGFNFALFRGS
ncbi:uncharacterized protein LOC106170896 [Lingula anatina]|uniref:Uncharacterized protein LOC106170896 n=1 Tax=Lingula anatina TaxID=7574 RepID=A0A1S3J7K6_LINAN|nr:uncharacterized protein LOC106170896 [Lingula anatina]|eukprot:XP_013406392.1 uncharacterized protein LOC106170896 [Lingula anatina]